MNSRGASRASLSHCTVSSVVYNARDSNALQSILRRRPRPEREQQDGRRRQQKSAEREARLVRRSRPARRRFCRPCRTSPRSKFPARGDDDARRFTGGVGASSEASSSPPARAKTRVRRVAGTPRPRRARGAMARGAVVAATAGARRIGPDDVASARREARGGVWGRREREAALQQKFSLLQLELPSSDGAFDHFESVKVVVAASAAEFGDASSPSMSKRETCLPVGVGGCFWALLPRASGVRAARSSTSSLA